MLLAQKIRILLKTRNTDCGEPVRGFALADPFRAPRRTLPQYFSHARPKLARRFADSTPTKSRFIDNSSLTAAINKMSVRAQAN